MRDGGCLRLSLRLTSPHKLRRTFTGDRWPQAGPWLRSRRLEPSGRPCPLLRACGLASPTAPAFGTAPETPGQLRGVISYSGSKEPTEHCARPESTPPGCARNSCSRTSQREPPAKDGAKVKEQACRTAPSSPEPSETLKSPLCITGILHPSNSPSACAALPSMTHPAKA